MFEDSKTVRDVCAEYTKPDHTCRNCEFTVCPVIDVFAGRVIAAHECELAEKDAEIARLVTKCNRLMAASPEIYDRARRLVLELDKVLDTDNNGNWIIASECSFIVFALEELKEVIQMRVKPRDL